LSKGKSDSVSKRETLQAWVAALVTVVLWASAFVGIRAAGEDLNDLVALYCALSVGRVDEAVCGEWQQGMRMSETDKSFEAAGLQGKAHNGSRTIGLVETRYDSRDRTKRTTTTG
jgi:hypothetical protein